MACNGSATEENALTTDSVATQSEPELQESFLDEVEPAPEETTPETAVSKPEKTTQNRQTAAPSHGGKETLYISTYGANGKVWGHVTMNGRTGRGTIHDDDENTYSITVTRHGGELFGIDQNGREYVFRL